ncbi:Dehydrogenase/reductase SDR member 12, partial [Perkinsus chesapeaki]
PLELSDFDSVREFAESLPKAGIDHLDIVLLNAGKWSDTFITNKEGIESMLAGHHLGHAYLFELLTPLMLKSSDEVRVVITSSAAHIFPHGDGIGYNITKEDFTPWTAYGNSKLANLLYARGLSFRMDEMYPGKFKVNSIHPGIVKTNLGPVSEKLPNFLAYSPLQAALTLVRPAVDEDVEADGYYLPVGYRGDWYKDSAYWWT